jgi:hypothetical protein
LDHVVLVLFQVLAALVWVEAWAEQLLCFVSGCGCVTVGGGVVTGEEFVVLLRWSQLVAVRWVSVLCWGGVGGGGVVGEVMVLLVRFWFLVAVVIWRLRRWLLSR